MHKYLMGVFILATKFGCTTLTFEGLADNTPVGNSYSGLGIVFSGGTAFVDSDKGGSGDFGGEPSPSTAVYTEFGLTINMPDGAFDVITFYYANPRSVTTVRAYSEINGLGWLLNEANLSATGSIDALSPTGSFSAFAFAPVQLKGMARSVMIVSRGPDGLFIDDLTISTAVPEPATVSLFGVAGVLALLRPGRLWKRYRFA